VADKIQAQAAQVATQYRAEMVKRKRPEEIAVANRIYEAVMGFPELERLRAAAQK
jgi:hypothetical protein